VLNKYDDLFNQQLKIIEDKLKEIFNDKKPKSLYESCAYSILAGGKRLRPISVLFANYIFSSTFENSYNTALAFEILHNFTLVHDDIMDNSDKRRNRLTVHKQYDVNTAILAGDTLYAYSFQLLLEDAKKTDFTICDDFTKAIIEVCEGQALDKEFETRSDVTVDEYMKMIYKKTAALLVGCFTAGAKIGGAKAEQLEAIKDYAKYLGLAFQIQDDFFDTFGDEEKFGKKVGLDIVEGKKTILLLKAIELADGNDKPILLQLLDNKGTTFDQVDIYRKIFYKYEVDKFAQSKIQEYIQLANVSIQKLKDIPHYDFLNWFSDLVLNRDK